MLSRTLCAVIFCTGFFVCSSESRAEDKVLHHAILELEKAEKHLKHENKHDQVNEAHRVLKHVIMHVKSDSNIGGKRREHLVKSLNHLDNELEKNHVRAHKALEEAIRELKHAHKG